MNFKCLSAALTITSDGSTDSSVCRALKIAINARIHSIASKPLPNLKPKKEVNVFEAMSKKNGKSKNIIT